MNNKKWTLRNMIIVVSFFKIVFTINICRKNKEIIVARDSPEFCCYLKNVKAKGQSDRHYIIESTCHLYFQSFLSKWVKGPLCNLLIFFSLELKAKGPMCTIPSVNLELNIEDQNQQICSFQLKAEDRGFRIDKYVWYIW